MNTPPPTDTLTRLRSALGRSPVFVCLDFSIYNGVLVAGSATTISVGADGRGQPIGRPLSRVFAPDRPGARPNNKTSFLDECRHLLPDGVIATPIIWAHAYRPDSAEAAFAAHLCPGVEPLDLQALVRSTIAVKPNSALAADVRRVGGLSDRALISLRIEAWRGDAAKAMAVLFTESLGELAETLSPPGSPPPSDRILGRISLGGVEITLRWTHYADGRSAVTATEEGGAPYGILSVNLPAVELAPDEIAVKVWSENAGLARAAGASGLFASTGRLVFSGKVKAPIWRILPRGKTIPSEVAGASSNLVPVMAPSGKPLRGGPADGADEATSSSIAHLIVAAMNLSPAAAARKLERLTVEELEAADTVMAGRRAAAGHAETTGPAEDVCETCGALVPGNLKFHPAFHPSAFLNRVTSADIEPAPSSAPAMDASTMEDHLRRLIAPEAIVLRLRDDGGNGLVLWTRGQKDWTVSRWATRLTDNSPVVDGAMFYSGGYWFTRADADRDFEQRAQY